MSCSDGEDILKKNDSDPARITRDQLAQLIIKEESFIPEFGMRIFNNRRELGGKWAAVAGAVFLFANRFVDARNQGRLNANKDPKL